MRLHKCRCAELIDVVSSNSACLLKSNKIISRCSIIFLTKHFKIKIKVNVGRLSPVTFGLGQPVRGYSPMTWTTPRSLACLPSRALAAADAFAAFAAVADSTAASTDDSSHLQLFSTAHPNTTSSRNCSWSKTSSRNFISFKT
jgi:hypothetical protein